MSMKKQGILLVAVVLFCMGSYAQAQSSELHGSVDLTYQSRYVWRGFDVYADKSAVQLGLDVDLFDTGFGLTILGHRANSSGFENAERWDYNLYYQNMLFGDQTYAMMYRLGWMYYNYPDLSQSDADLQELHAILSLPKLCPAGVVPTYVLVKLWPNSSGSLVAKKFDLATGQPSAGTASGWAHIFMLDYPLKTTGILPDTPEQVFNFHAEAVYNDGVGPAGQNVDHDWSNAVFGVSTDSSVNDDKDETWVTLSMTYKF
jgi:hypothetical protein